MGILNDIRRGEVPDVMEANHGMEFRFCYTYSSPHSATTSFYTSITICTPSRIYFPYLFSYFSFPYRCSDIHTYPYLTSSLFTLSINSWVLFIWLKPKIPRIKTSGFKSQELLLSYCPDYFDVTTLCTIQTQYSTPIVFVSFTLTSHDHLRSEADLWCALTHHGI